MTFQQLYNALDKNEYILIRTFGGMMYAINCKAKNIMVRRHKFNPDDESNVMSFRSCNFQEYISYKPTFM